MTLCMYMQYAWLTHVTSAEPHFLFISHNIALFVKNLGGGALAPSAPLLTTPLPKQTHETFARVQSYNKLLSMQ